MCSRDLGSETSTIKNSPDPLVPALQRYNATISACSWHLAIALLRRLLATSLRPNVLTYGGSAAERTRKWGENRGYGWFHPQGYMEGLY